MMKVSTKSTYAIRALIHLARNSEAKPLRLASIAAVSYTHLTLPTSDLV